MNNQKKFKLVIERTSGKIDRFSEVTSYSWFDEVGLAVVKTQDKKFEYPVSKIEKVIIWLPENEIETNAGAPKKSLCKSGKSERKARLPETKEDKKCGEETKLESRVRRFGR